MSYLQAIIIGLIQGVTELFPVSSLGHSVIVPGLFGWHNIVNAQSANESFYLAFLVGLHVATALALLWVFRDRLRARPGLTFLVGAIGYAVIRFGLTFYRQEVVILCGLQEAQVIALVTGVLALAISPTLSGRSARHRTGSKIRCASGAVCPAFSV